MKYFVICIGLSLASLVALAEDGLTVSKGVCTIDDTRGKYADCEGSAVLLNNQLVQCIDIIVDHNNGYPTHLTEKSNTIADKTAQKLADGGVCIYIGTRQKLINTLE